MRDGTWRGVGVGCCSRMLVGGLDAQNVFRTGHPKEDGGTFPAVLLLAVVLNGRCAALNGFQQGLTINPPGGSR